MHVAHYSASQDPLIEHLVHPLLFSAPLLSIATEVWEVPELPNVVVTLYLSTLARA